MPQASKQVRVDCTSEPVAKFDIRESPSANAANMSARGEMDLSPGNEISPLMAIIFQFVRDKKGQLNRLVCIEPWITVGSVSVR